MALSIYLLVLLFVVELGTEICFYGGKKSSAVREIINSDDFWVQCEGQQRGLRTVVSPPTEGSRDLLRS